MFSAYATLTVGLIPRFPEHRARSGQDDIAVWFEDSLQTPHLSVVTAGLDGASGDRKAVWEESELMGLQRQWLRVNLWLKFQSATCYTRVCLF